MQKKGTGFYAMYGVKMVDTYIPMYDASKNEKIESQTDPQNRRNHYTDQGKKNRGLLERNSTGFY